MITTLRASVVTLLLSALANHGARADETLSITPREVIPVAMYDSAGASGKGPKMLEDKFHQDTNLRITRITAEKIRAGKLKDYKVLIVPGGLSKTQGIALGEDGRDMIRKFVNDGGTYIGICAGCYLASSNYNWSLGILPANVVDSANWERGITTLKMELTSEGKEWMNRPNDSMVKTNYHNGPVLEPIKDAKTPLIPLAYYRQEVTRKGAKEGLMINTPACAAARYGNGWAIGVSPHPEQTADLKDLIPSAIHWTLKNPSK